MGDFYEASKAKSLSFTPDTDIPALEGKVILVTGANTGLGKQTALDLAKHNPAQLWMTARDTTKGQAAVNEVKKQSPGVDVRALELDLTSFASVKQAAAHFTASVTRLDTLYLNAGILGAPPNLTADGYEIHIGVNHVGHALLLKLLAPLLSKTAAKTSKEDVRVVSLASIGYKFIRRGGIDFGHLKQASHPEITQIERYTQSKLANLLYAREAARAYPDFIVVSLDPGPVESDLFSREAGDDSVRHLQTVLVPRAPKVTVAEGVKNQLWAGTARGVVSGVYYESVGVDAAEGVGKDEAMANKLWQWTEKELEGQEL